MSPCMPTSPRNLHTTPGGSSEPMVTGHPTLTEVLGEASVQVSVEVLCS